MTLFSYTGPYGGVTLLQQLHCNVVYSQNTPSAFCWLRPVIDDGGR